MVMRSTTAQNRAGAGARNVATLLMGATLAALAGCEINKPETPTFVTTLTLPLGVERLDVIDAIDSEDFLAAGPDGTLLFQVDGEPDTLNFNFDLNAEVTSQSISEGLGTFELDAVDQLNYGFLLRDIWPPAAGAEGWITLVPAFPILATSPDQDVPDITSATLSTGTARVTVDNGLAVAISAASGPNQLVLVLESQTGQEFASFTFGLIPAGASQTGEFDLAGKVMPDRLRVRLAGGSAGSNGQPVTVNGDDRVDVIASFTDLIVSSATAAVGAQTLSMAFNSPLPSNYEVTEAVVAEGASQLAMTNGLPMPCTAILTWPDLRDSSNQPLIETFTLAAGASITRTIDFAGYTLSAGDTPLTALDATVEVTSPGSAGLPVTLSANDGLTATLGATTIAFASVTGVVPEAVVILEPTVQQIDLPDELDGLSLTAARLTLHLDTTASLPGTVELTLRGERSDGMSSELIINQALGEIVLDQDNSDIVDFLNHLPRSITLLGQITLGGDGAVGTVRTTDTAAVILWQIDAPVEVIIDGATLNSDPRALNVDTDLRDRITTHARGARAQIEVLNHLPLALDLKLLVGQDAATLGSAPLLTIGPLTVTAALTSASSHTVTQSVISRPEFNLTAEQAQVFGLPGLVTKVVATLPSSGGNPARVLSTDYLEVSGLVQLDVLIDDQF